MRAESKIKPRLKGFTLAECLVVMIIGGIVLLGITEGLGMFSGYISKRGELLTIQQRSYSDLAILSEVFSVCDSIKVSDGKTAVYSRGERIVFSSPEGRLFMEKGTFRDTLLPGCAASVTLADSTGNDGLPRIKLSIDTGTEETFEHTFAPRLSQTASINKTLTETEEPYLYE